MVVRGGGGGRPHARAVGRRTERGRRRAAWSRGGRGRGGLVQSTQHGVVVVAVAGAHRRRRRQTTAATCRQRADPGRGCSDCDAVSRGDDGDDDT